MNGKRTVTVSANVQGIDAGTVSKKAKEIADGLDYPEGFGVGLGGASRDQDEVFGEMGVALFMGIGVMYLVLVMQFNSFFAPVAIMLSLPLSLIGVVLALNLAGSTINLMSLIGVIMLMGLVAKNAILLLDCARKEEEQGVDREEALMHAGRVRLRPILMTTFALVAGMMPVAIGVGEGGEFYRPMALAIIGGVIVSTLLTLLVVPSFYDSIEINRERAVLKMHARAALYHPAWAFLAMLGEVLLTLTDVVETTGAMSRAARLLTSTAASAAPPPTRSTGRRASPSRSTTTPASGPAADSAGSGTAALVPATPSSALAYTRRATGPGSPSRAVANAARVAAATSSADATS
jgi:HAE1 family hydrophobic/amphiphilic exporter-1